MTVRQREFQNELRVVPTASAWPAPSAMASSSTLTLLDTAPKLSSSASLPTLTPRSSEACRRTGIEPSELLPLPLEAFREPGQRPEVEKKRMERYEQLRVEAERTENRLAADARRQRALEAKREARQAEVAAVREGKKPFFAKKSALREQLRLDKIAELKKKGKLDKYLAKKSAKSRVAGVGGSG